MIRRIGTTAAAALCCTLAGVGLVGCDDEAEPAESSESSDSAASDEETDEAGTPGGAGVEQIELDGQTVDVNIHCAGESAEGQPVVFLLHGGGEDLTNMADLQETLSADGQVCSYDRLGAGGSDAPLGPQDFEDTGTILGGVIEEVASGKPVVLAGHSMGGLIAARYAPENEQVAGVVLLDATGPNAAADFAERIPEDVEGPAAELRAAQLAVFEGQNPEQLVFADGDVVPAGDIPVRVLQHGVQYLAELDPEYGEGLEEDWTAAQEEWLSLSSDSERTVVENAGHYIHTDAPEAAVEAISDVVARAAG
ncbi:Pimeloyl-ACP methyl ester carboxylesterase [Streptomyces zhaozhouensis]|uniref:Pimeloyl-ACP methyl ester carboxylesterase n=1 Tax=Streptomyces zhaozhouensis TaxID=1300267 RepID=A0A286DT66_9ACTN|nr:alpha/beta fold hydrolase [Streptomyces zhaozhouensis]SOD61838.1 Pimeloyl-ACP methyl ester carboxylesterase [Streptomyces zhaozhouensis]